MSPAALCLGDVRAPIGCCDSQQNCRLNSTLAEGENVRKTGAYREMPLQVSRGVELNLDCTNENTEPHVGCQRREQETCDGSGTLVVGVPSAYRQDSKSAPEHAHEQNSNFFTYQTVALPSIMTFF